MPALEEDLATLLAPLPSEVAAVTLRLVALVAANPRLSGKVKFGWKSVNFHHAAAGYVCAIFPYQDRVALYFEHGRFLQDSEKLLQGDLKKGAFICFRPEDTIQEDAVGILLAEAIVLKA